MHTHVYTHWAQTLLLLEHPGSAPALGLVHPDEQPMSEVPGAPGSKPSSGREAGELLPVPGWLGKSFRV